MKPSQKPDSESPFLQAGATLSDRYLIQGTISASSLSTVYRARDLHFPNVVKLVAVKDIINQAPDPRKQIKFFERQVNILATLSHPAIPRILDCFTDERHCYLVLEFIHGETLEAIMSKTSGFIEGEKVIHWTIELCEVLGFLHSHQPEPIFFRDLNPAHIMLNQHGRLVLIDFGITKSFHSSVESTMVSKQGYSPPEQYQGEVSAITDIYSLGATMHHLLTGQDPRQEPPFSFAERPIRQTNPRISPELETIVATALQSKPSERYQSVEKMKAALLETMGRSDSRHQSPQFSPTMASTEEDIQPIWTFTCEDEIRGTASCARGTVYVGSYDNNLYAFKIESGKLAWKYPTDGGIVSQPIIFEDYVFFGSEDNRLHVVSARSGSLQWTYYTRGPVRSSPFNAHGHIFIGSDDAALHAININGGRGVWQTETSAEIRSTPYVTQEAIYFGNEVGELYCLDFRGGIKWRFKAKRAITSSPTVADDLVLFCSLDSNFYALDAKSGFLVWRFPLGKGSISSPFVAEGLAYTGSIDGNIYCVALGSAKEVWRFQTGHQVTGSPIVHKDRLYCGSVDGHLYCLDSQTGQLRWKFKTDKPLTATPTAADEIIFIGSNDHRFYALPARETK
jgi:outer membrane protein assembly factor BamB/tRNA A-37 threonylcarbamoyl transferase component Bud32